MSTSAFDLIIIGGGPGGYVAAIRAAQLGLRVVVVERDKLGGICLNWGCIPSKALLQNASVVETMQHASDFGVQIPSFSADFSAAIARSRKIVNKLLAGVEFLMKKNKIEVIKGDATLTAGDRVEVQPGGRALTAKNIIIATGARPRAIPGLTIDGSQVISSREALELAEVPNPIVIVGGSAVGMEFATIYRSYGAEVTVIEMLPHLLPKEDEGISFEFEKAMKKADIKFRVNTKVVQATRLGDKIQLDVSTNAQMETIHAQRVLMAVGFSRT